MRRIVFTNDKGGVGKTTTVVNLAVGMAGAGRKTLVIDMDPQADATFALLGERPPETSGGYVAPSTHALLSDHYPLTQVTISSPRYANLSVVPANSDLADTALRLARRPTKLRKILQENDESLYDIVLIDTGKGLDPLAINALVAADEVIGLVSPGRLELDAIDRMLENISLVREEILLNQNGPQIRGILLTQADPYSVTRDTIVRIESSHPNLLFKTNIPKNNDLPKSDWPCTKHIRVRSKQ